MKPTTQTVSDERLNLWRLQSRALRSALIALEHNDSPSSRAWIAEARLCAGAELALLEDEGPNHAPELKYWPNPHRARFLEAPTRW